jgi:hypothetical protein
MSSPLTQIRIETTVAELRAISNMVFREFGDIDPATQRSRISDAVRIYCAKLIQESQK